MFIVHGEQESKLNFVKTVNNELGINCIVPEYNVSYEIKKSKQIEKISIDAKEVSQSKIKAKVNEKLVKDLLADIEELKRVFDIAADRTKNYVNENINIDEYKKINNIIIDLENEVINLTMLTNE